MARLPDEAKQDYEYLLSYSHNLKRTIYDENFTEILNLPFQCNYFGNFNWKIIVRKNSINKRCSVRKCSNIFI